jgi:class 3 adenylate cyclase/tetratricopeptide (TPR) repeat protein
VTCPVCATVTLPGARFCHQCGVALPAAAATATAERRTVTVLFGDLSEFTAWSEGVDPERVGAVTDRVLAALAGAVKTFGGHVDKLTGDGIMGVFGAPVAHEDDPERAVRAALSMQRAVRRVLDDERGGGAPAGLRIGLNTGVVVAGVQAGLEYTVIGDTVNTAARLADSAPVGAVYAGSATSTATRHLASWRRLLPLRLKGKRDPVDAYELNGLLDAPGTRSGLGDEAPFVGREAELGLVASRLAEVRDRGEPRVLVFTGDGGSGKSRFAAETARFAAGYDRGTGSGARVLAIRCAAYGERRRLAPLADLVRAAIGLPAEPGAAEPIAAEPVASARKLAAEPVASARKLAAEPVASARKLAAEPAASARKLAEERLRRVAAVVERRTGAAPRLHTELLLAVLGYADPTLGQSDSRLERAAGERGGPLRREFNRDAMPAAVADLLSALASDAALVVLVDDLDDAAPEALDALGAMISRLAGPVLVLLLGRPELVRSAGALTRLADAEIHPLPPLRGAESARLLTEFLGEGRLPAADEDRLLATAQGNPFYLAELVTLLMERGVLVRTASTGGTPRWSLAPDSLDGRLLSRDLAALLAARIDALPHEARAVLRDAAVVGDTVPAAALAAIREPSGPAGARPAAVAAVELERALDELLHRRMLLPVRGGYAFATPLLREAAYAGVGKADLASRHARLARWAASLATPAPSLGWTAQAQDTFVADHAEQAAGLADAVSLRADASARAVAPLGIAALARLARRAITSAEPAQAALFAERATALAGSELPAADRLVHASALLQLGRAAEALTAAEKICVDHSEPDPASRARALLLAGRAHRALGEPDRGDRVWAEALTVATAAGLPAERAEALRRIGMDDYLRGQLGLAETRFREAYEISLRAGDRRGQAWSLQNVAWVSTTRGDFTAADTTLAAAARLFAELGDTAGRAWLRGTTAFTRLLAGRLAEARRLAGLFLPFGQRVGELWAVGTLRAVEAFASAELGDLATADRQAREAFARFDEIDDDWGRGFALVVRGAVARGLAEPEHAVDLLSSACDRGDRTGHPLLIGMAGTIRGFARLECGDAEGAEADARAVLRLAEPRDAAAVPEGRLASFTDAGQVGPRVLLGRARIARGDLEGGLADLAEVAVDRSDPAVLFSARLAVAEYGSALLAAGRTEEALDAARRAVRLPAEDVRGRVVAGRTLARALAAAGLTDEARATAVAAVREAYATQQVSERAATEAVLAALS